MGKLDGKVAFITGAARGQGRSHALALAAEGANIIALDISEQVPTATYPTATNDDLQQTIEEVKALGRRIIADDVDIRELTALKEFVDRAVVELGRLDIVVANAGICSPAPTLEMDETVWDEMIEINLTGQWKTIRAAVPHIRATGQGGSVVITSSLAAFYANENTAHYSAAKAGLVGFMHVLAKELAPESIRVNTVHPTLVATDMVHNQATYDLFRPDLQSPTRGDFEVAARTLNKLPTPTVECQDVSDAVLYLVTESGRYVTGSTLTIDAGGRL